ncbi:IclR family transcriptional regulator [Neobacillus sp. NPDC093127]|uniref:IclR family transcriptional regulator n=1 Tax=Neobacillus sp. NPDC093127 TaxID=3364296 RepID=UPI0037F2A60D
MTTNIDRNSGLASVRNSIHIMKSFSISQPSRRVTDLAKELGLAKSTVSRLVSTLASEGFLEKDPETQEYRLGLGVLALSGVLTHHLEIHKEAAPVLANVVATTKETAHIAILDGFDTVYIDKEEGVHQAKMKTYLGKRNPTHAVSSGKVLLAFSSEEFIDAYIENGLSSYASRTITDPYQLKNVLKRIREDDYALSYAEFSDDIASIAAPIRDYTGKVVAAITVVGHGKGMMSGRMNQIIRVVKEAAKEASERLGYDDRYFRRK